jgi:hypothetical protein
MILLFLRPKISRFHGGVDSYCGLLCCDTMYRDGRLRVFTAQQTGRPQYEFETMASCLHESNINANYIQRITKKHLEYGYNPVQYIFQHMFRFKSLRINFIQD